MNIHIHFESKKQELKCSYSNVTFQQLTEQGAFSRGKTKLTSTESSSLGDIHHVNALSELGGFPSVC